MFSPWNLELRRFILCLTIGGGICWSGAAGGAEVTFTPVGFLPGDDHSAIQAVDDAGTLSVGFSYHRSSDPPYPRIFAFAARWTLSEGMQPLPLLPGASGVETGIYFVTGKDVTADGKTILYVSHTADDQMIAAGIVGADGSKPVNLTALPNGDKMPTAVQISDDAQTVFGFRYDGFFYPLGSIWTASGGVQALVPPPGFSHTQPAARAISSDGSVSVGTMSSNYDTDGFSATEGYRWTASDGFEGLGYLPGGNSSAGLAVTPDGNLVLGTATFDDEATSINYDNDLFLWSAADGMLDLGRPFGLYGQFGGGSLTPDGAVAAVSTIFGTSYVVNTAGKAFFEFERLLLDAGLENSIAGWSDFLILGMTPDAQTIYGLATNPDGNDEGFIVKFPANYLRNLPVPPQPVITSSPEVTAVVGQPFTYQITASNDPSYYFFDPSYVPGLQFDSESGLISGTPTAEGDYARSIYAYNANGYDRVILTIHVLPAPVARLLNISTRLRVLTGENVLIGGFIVTGDEPKEVILRAIGPGLISLGINDALGDPVLALHKFDGSVFTNDNWKDSQEAEIAASGLQPTDDHESALIATLEPGAYTAIVSGKDGGTGVGLVEAYDLSQGVNSKLANISTRGFVDTGDHVLIGGLIVGSSAQVVVRALGPSLGSAGVMGALQNPTLEIHNPDGSTLASNDDWKETQETEIETSGFAPTDDRESAILVTLPANGYTAIVRGKDETIGVGLVEVYNLD